MDVYKVEKNDIWIILTQFIDTSKRYLSELIFMDYCFCTIALRSPYRLLAKNLAEDLKKYAPNTNLLIFSDEPDDFKDYQNILAFKYYQKGIPHCWNDRRFVVEKALSMYRSAIHIDADTRIVGNLPEQIKWLPGITAMTDDLLQHAHEWMYAPDVNLMRNLGDKLKIPLEKAKLIHESLYIITRDDGREVEFLKEWDIIARTLELKGYTSSDGYLMGMAAQKVGLSINKDGWESLKSVTNHFFADDNRKPKSFWKKLQRKMNYSYRLNRARLTQILQIET